MRRLHVLLTSEATSTMGNVSTTGYTYDFYRNVLTFPFVGLYIFGVLLLLYPGFRLVRSLCCRESARCDTLDLGDLSRLPAKAFLYSLPKQIFKIYEERDVEGLKEIYVGGRKLLPVQKNKDGSDNRALIVRVVLTMGFLFINSISILVCAFVISWNIFLVAQTSGCNPELDCYPLRGGSPVQKHPIISCADFESLENVTIQCFRFKFQFGAGVAAFGGLLKFGESVLWIFVSISLWAVDSWMYESKATDSKICLNAKYGCAAIVLFFTFISPLALVIGPIYISIFYVEEWSTRFRDIVYIFTVFLIASYVVILVCLVQCRKRESFDPEIRLTGSRAPQQHGEEVPATNTDCRIELKGDTELEPDNKPLLKT